MSFDRHQLLWKKLRKRSNSAPSAQVLKNFGCQEPSLVAAAQDQIWLAHKSGKLKVFRYRIDPGDLSLNLDDNEAQLYGHFGDVTALDLCPQFGIALSGSKDKSAIVWDTDKLKFVLSLDFETAVSGCAVSRTCGDLCVVTDGEDETSSYINAFTINGSSLGHVRCEPRVTSVTFSSCPEGVAVNVIATGHFKTGTVRLWSSWDLAPIRDVCTLQESPVIAIAFNSDNQNLYASTEDGEVVVFEKATISGLGQAPKFGDLTYM